MRIEEYLAGPETSRSFETKRLFYHAGEFTFSCVRAFAVVKDCLYHNLIKWGSPYESSLFQV